MQVNMIGLCHYLQIAGVIVVPVAINVVNNLPRQ